MAKRIIPAYAGLMSEELGRPLTTWDHPRIRGTNFVALIIARIDIGSSPHTRD